MYRHVMERSLFSRVNKEKNQRRAKTGDEKARGKTSPSFCAATIFFTFAIFFAPSTD